MAQLGMVNMTREELHQLVWSQPMRTAAKSMGISDVALAKQCRKANVPVPPRGWWARKAAGKRVELEALPPLPFAMANYFPALERPLNSNVASAEPAEEEPSAPPTFRDLAEITLEFQAAVKVIRVPATLGSPIPLSLGSSSRMSPEEAVRLATGISPITMGSNSHRKRSSGGYASYRASYTNLSDSAARCREALTQVSGSV